MNRNFRHSRASMRDRACTSTCEVYAKKYYNQRNIIVNYQEIRKNTKQFQSLTSLSVEEFDELIPLFDDAWTTFIYRYKLDGTPRVRKYSPKDTDTLATVEEKLFFILIYQKNNPLQEFLAASFGLTQDMTNKWIHALSLLLIKAMKQYRPSRRAEDIKILDESQHIIDATERPVERDTYEQEQFFSGKKKHHAVKNLILCTMTSFVVFLSPTVYGTVHDKKLADQTLCFSKPTEILADLGFIGYKPAFAEIKMPHKKPKNKELTKIQKKQNMLLSRDRVLVEHVIGHIKIMRIVKDKNRNRKFGYRDLVMDTAVTLHNFRVTKRRVNYFPESFCS